VISQNNYNIAVVHRPSDVAASVLGRNANSRTEWAIKEGYP